MNINEVVLTLYIAVYYDKLHNGVLNHKTTPPLISCLKTTPFTRLSLSHSGIRVDYLVRKERKIK